MLSSITRIPVLQTTGAVRTFASGITTSVNLEFLKNALGEATIDRDRNILDRLYRRFIDPYNRHRSLVTFQYAHPQLLSQTFVAPSATVVGDVQIGDFSSVWYGAVIRGDSGPVVVGAKTNIQDGALLTTDEHTRLEDGSVLGIRIGNRVTIGHEAQLISCVIGDDSLIGMGAIIQAGSIVEPGAIVAAGAVVPAGTRIPAGQMWAGNPARFIRNVSEDESEFIPEVGHHYSKLAEDHQFDLQEEPAFTAYTQVEKMMNIVARRRQEILAEKKN